MTKSTRKSNQGSFIDDIFSERPYEEPVASPPAPLSSDQEKGGTSRGAEAVEGQQLSLPLETRPGAPPRRHSGRKGARKAPRGFVPVTHDPDVARSYSDNASMDQAIAQGLAQVLASMPAEELAALKAKVARAAAREGRNETSRGPR